MGAEIQDADVDMERPAPRADDLSLMAGPSGREQFERVARATAEYTRTGDRFTLNKKTFSNQYAQIYYTRLTSLLPAMRERAQKAWPGLQVSSVLDVREGVETVVIGTLYKDMKLKPSILTEYTKERGLEQLAGRAKFTEASDSLVLEDESARVQIKGAALPPADSVTGAVAALRGTAVAGGDFWATECLWPDMRPQAPPPPPARGAARYVAFVSGLALGDAAANPARVSLLLDWLTGMLGAAPEQAAAAQVVRVVIAGGLVSCNEALAAATAHSGSRQQQQGTAAALASLREADMALSELAAAVPVDLMPGANDPATAALPQQPLHACLFPGAAAFATLGRVTNPHEFELEGRSFLGSSGQNVDDVYKYSGLEDRLDCLAALLRWGHLAPTAPDTLGCYPYGSDDPFLLTAAPHVLFAGNQPRLQTRLVEGPEGQAVRLLCVPKFCETGQIALVNVDNLKVQPLSFGTMLG